MNMKITFSISYVRITVDAAYEDDDQVKMDDDLQKNFLSAIGDPSKGNLKPFRYLQFGMFQFPDILYTVCSFSNVVSGSNTTFKRINLENPITISLMSESHLFSIASLWSLYLALLPLGYLFLLICISNGLEARALQREALIWITKLKWAMFLFKLMPDGLMDGRTN